MQGRRELVRWSPILKSLLQISGTRFAFSMLPRAISTVLTPVFAALAVLLHGREIEADGFCVPAPAPPPAVPCQCRLLRTGSKVRTLTRQPAKRRKSSGRLNLRSSPGELASSVYSAPGTRSSTSRRVPKSRLNAAQSSCVTPESCSTLNFPFDQPLRQALRCFPVRCSCRQLALATALVRRRFFQEKFAESALWQSR